MWLIIVASVLGAVKLEELNDNRTIVVYNMSIVGQIGGQVKLPCQPLAKESNVDLSLAIWTIIENEKPEKNQKIPVFKSTPDDTTKRIYGTASDFSLMIKNLSQSDNKIYECEAFRNQDTIYHYIITVIVSGPPDPPEIVELAAVSQREILINWTLGNDNNSPIVSHEINVFRNLGDPKSIEKNISMPLTFYHVKSLHPFTDYYVKMRAFSSAGGSKFSPTMKVTTLAGHFTVRPSVDIINVTSRDVTLRIKPSVNGSAPSQEELNGRLEKWMLKITKDEHFVYNVTRTWPTEPHETALAHASHLSPDTEYTLSVFIYNGRYYGPPTIVGIRTKKERPQTPKSIKLQYIKPDSIGVYWTLPDINLPNVPINYYKLRYSIKNSDVVKEVNVTDGHSYDILNTKPKTEYLIRVAACNEMGCSPFQKLRAETMEHINPPPKITDTTILHDKRVIHFNWTLSSVQNKNYSNMKWSFCVLSEPAVSECVDIPDWKRVGVTNQEIHFEGVIPFKKLPKSLKQGISTISIKYSTICPNNNNCLVENSQSASKQILISNPFFPEDADNVFELPIILGIIVVLLVILAAVIFGSIFLKTRCVFRTYARRVEEEERIIAVPPPVNVGVKIAPFVDSPYPPIPITNLAEHVAAYRANDNAGYQAEFENVERSVKQDYPATIGSCPSNMSKNRYSNVIAYDHSRVALKNLHGRKSDYINASYIDGYHKPKAYIATQGPLPSTFADFWQMIWEEKCNAIVMISNFTERGRRKCDMYWPPHGSQIEGVISIKMVSQTDLAYFTIRVFAIRNIKCKKTVKERIVYHYHYTDWRDFDVPNSPLPVLNFVKSTIRHASGPIVVHCSAGVGRTGTYICIDSLIRQMEAEYQVNIRGFLEFIRQERMKLVQTEEQYAFIHDALREYLICPDHQIKREHISSVIRYLKEKDPCGCTGMQKQYQLCVEWKPDDFWYFKAKKPANMSKNRTRDPSVLPIASRPVLLPGEPGVEESDYINASYINGYWNLFEYIVTQHPTDLTESGFWKMVWNENCSIIILLSPDNNDEYPKFWPDEGLETRRVGWLTIGYRDQEEIGLTTKYEFLLSSSREDYALECQLYWIKAVDELATIELIRLTSHLAEMKNTAGPTLVVDEFGSNKAGIFCALNSLINQVDNEGIVDVYFFVKMFHLQRPNIWHSYNDLEFLYTLIERYINENEAPRIPMVNGWIADRPISPTSTLERSNRNSNPPTTPAPPPPVCQNGSLPNGNHNAGRPQSSLLVSLSSHLEENNASAFTPLQLMSTSMTTSMIADGHNSHRHHHPYQYQSASLSRVPHRVPAESLPASLARYSHCETVVTSTATPCQPNSTNDSKKTSPGEQTSQKSSNSSRNSNDQQEVDLIVEEDEDNSLNLLLSHQDSVLTTSSKTTDNNSDFVTDSGNLRDSITLPLLLSNHHAYSGTDNHFLHDSDELADTGVSGHAETIAMRNNCFNSSGHHYSPSNNGQVNLNISHFTTANHYDNDSDFADDVTNV